MRIQVHITQHRYQKSLQQQNEQLKQLVKNQAACSESHQTLCDAPVLIGQSQAVRKIISDINRLKNSNISVLLEGECGTGKELVACAIHKASKCAQGPFVAVNCAAIPFELAESEFFGSVRGAFTGSLCNRKGYFELAEGGTLFLDEVGEMPLLLQVKLLRALEEKVIRPIGGTHTKLINVRIIAATNANLPEMITAGRFRKDLYFRLAGFQLEIAPLRTRKEDIKLLATHFLNQLTTKELSQSALTALENYDFLGNVRELKNIMERAVLYCDGQTIQPQHLHLLAITSPSQQFLPPALKSIQTKQFLTTDAEKILEFVQKFGYINNVLCRQLLKVNHNRATYLLKKMTGNGDLVRVGNNRATSYLLTD